MEITHNVVGWFEIPVTDMEHAIKFYETVFGFKLSRQQMGPADMAWFPMVEEGIGAPGSLIYLPDVYTPSKARFMKTSASSVSINRERNSFCALSISRDSLTNMSEMFQKMAKP